MLRTTTEEPILTGQNLSWNLLGTGTLSDSAILVHSQPTCQIVLGEDEVRIEPKDHGKGPFPNWVTPTVKALLAKLDLAPDWDTYGGQPVEQRAVLAALEILDGAMSDNTKAPWVVATTDGGIQLEWHREGEDLEVEISGSGDATLYFNSTPTGEELEVPLAGALPRLSNLLAKWAIPD